MSQNEIVKKYKSYDEFLVVLAKNIKLHRKQLGLSQEDMIDFGFNYRFYQKLESGNYSPNLKTIYKLSAALNIPMHLLLRG